MTKRKKTATGPKHRKYRSKPAFLWVRKVKRLLLARDMSVKEFAFAAGANEGAVRTSFSKGRAPKDKLGWAKVLRVPAEYIFDDDYPIEAEKLVLSTSLENPQTAMLYKAAALRDARQRQRGSDTPDRR